MNVHDQSICPKCHRMFCEGYWKEGVCIADMGFCGEPTADGDSAADYFRVWYEAHRETWLDRHWPFGVNRKHGSALADGFVLRLFNEVCRINNERDRQTTRRQS